MEPIERATTGCTLACDELFANDNCQSVSDMFLASGTKMTSVGRGISEDLRTHVVRASRPRYSQVLIFSGRSDSAPFLAR